MALLTINGVGIISGSILMPLNGVWTGDLVIDQPNGNGFSAGTPVAIVAADSGFTINGVVSPARTGDFLDTVHVRVLGGAGGMANDVQPRAYVQPGAFGKDVIAGLMTDSGETLASTSDPTLLNANLAAWAVMAGPTSQALDTLIKFNSPTDHWRFLSDGTLWIGSETWPASSDEYILINQNPAEGTFDLGVDTPSIMPGVSISGVGNINLVEHQILSDSIRSKVWIDLDTTSRGLASAITSIIQKETADIDYFALYFASVVSQNGSVCDVIFSDQRLAGMSNVAIRSGIPGHTFQVTPGCNILVGWEDGNPSKPYAALWGGGESVLSETIGVASGIGQLNLGGTAIQAVIKGTIYRTNEDVLFAALIAFAGVVANLPTSATSWSTIDPSGAAATSLSTGLTTLTTVLGVFEAAAASYLSLQVKTV